MDAPRTETFYQTAYQHCADFFSNCSLTSYCVIMYVSLFGIGFLVGALFKRYGKWIVAITLSLILALTLLHYFDLITINTCRIKQLFGLQRFDSVDAVVAYIKQLRVELIIITISVLLGFKLG